MSDQNDPAAERTLSHSQAGEMLDETLARKRREISGRGDLADVTVAEQLDLLEQLAAFPFGRFVLQNRGWNGYWTDVVMEHPARGRKTATAPDGRPLTSLERQLLDSFPTVLATQERSRHFADAIQEHLGDGAVLASIPCGLMRDLLGRDCSSTANFRFVGIDIDQDSLSRAERLAEHYGLAAVTTFRRDDAWALGTREAFDLIASNGLNIYEPDDGRVTALYRGFFEALKPGGVLITSFLTPPPSLDPASEWNLDAVDPHALRLQRIVFIDIVGASFQCYRNAATTKAQLEAAGFSSLDLVWDSARMFPTVIARKVA